jgi:pimeloyl-[acyl-carrier protein] methyl ester esterase
VLLLCGCFGIDGLASSMRRLVLLPGMDGTGELFSGFATALSEEFEITIVRYPTGQTLSYAELESFVRGICPTSESFVLLAESYSTPLAIKYAASEPAGLKGLVLCAGFATSPVRGWRRLLALVFAPVAFYVPIPDLAARRWLVGTDAAPSLLAAMRAAIASVKPKVLVGRLRSALACDVRGEVEKIGVPTLYIRAEQDRLVSASCAEELKRIDPGMATATLAGPHLLLQRQPQQAAEIVLNFIRSSCSS